MWPGSLQILVTSIWLRDFLYFNFPFCLSCLAQCKSKQTITFKNIIKLIWYLRRQKQPKTMLPKWDEKLNSYHKIASQQQVKQPLHKLGDYQIAQITFL